MVFVGLMTIFFIGCKSVSQQEKLIKYKQKGYGIRYNDTLINVNDIFVDFDNLKEVKKEKRNKEIVLIPKDSNSSFTKISEMVFKAEQESNIKISSVAIDRYGYIDKERFDNVKIESSAIKESFILKDASAPGLDMKTSYILVILTKIIKK